MVQSVTSLLISVVFLVTSLWASPVFANDDSGVSTIEEIVVTSRQTGGKPAGRSGGDNGFQRTPA